MLQSNSSSKNKKVSEFSTQLTSSLTKFGKFTNDYAINKMVAYALYKAQSIFPDTIPAFSELISNISTNELIRFSIENTVEDYWDDLQVIYNRFNIETIVRFILSNETSVEPKLFSATPSSVTELALEILNIKDGDTVADFGTGYGSFFVNAYRKNVNAHYYAIDINSNLATIAAIKAELLSQNIVVEQGNMFAISNHPNKFDKVFSNYPFGMRISYEVETFLETLNYIPPKSRSSDWIFNLLLIESLKTSGKAIGIMTSGACFNSADREMREFFVKNGYIEAIIALPDRLFADTNIATEMIVLSKGNKSIRMVDASKLSQKGRRQSELTGEHIQKIIKALDENNEYSHLVSPENLIDEGYNLDPTKRLIKPVKIENGIKFSEVINNITRGAQLNAETLDGITSSKPTNFQYLMLRDIQDGLINEKLPYLNNIEKRLEKYCISPGNLVMSKNGAPFKVAIAGETKGKSILANGNLYVIELDESKIRPYYLKAFFESEIGTTTLSSIAVGTAMPVIQVEALKSITIPCPPIEEQIKIEAQYLQNIDFIRTLKNQLSSAIETSKTFFAEGK